jgi:hypothetical protein
MDELQSLKELFPDPPPPAEPVVQRQREALMAMIDDATDAAAAVRPNRRHRRRVMAMIVTPAAAVVLAAAGWAVLRTEATEATGFVCVADGVTSVIPNDGTPPVDVCRSHWEAGYMVRGVTEAPPLAACVYDSGWVMVIPATGDDPCEGAGMGTWAGQDQYHAVGAAIRGALVSFHDRYQATGNGCASEQDWRNALEDRLGPTGDAWTMEVDEVEAGRRCFGVGSVDPTTMTITLIGHPGDYSIGCDPRTGC